MYLVGEIWGGVPLTLAARSHRSLNTFTRNRRFFTNNEGEQKANNLPIVVMIWIIMLRESIAHKGGKVLMQPYKYFFRRQTHIFPA
jgi:hypothetical protein